MRRLQIVDVMNRMMTYACATALLALSACDKSPETPSSPAPSSTATTPSGTGTSDTAGGVGKTGTTDAGAVSRSGMLGDTSSSSGPTSDAGR